MKLSVIIACFNAADTVGVQLEALAAQTWTDDWEIIVVDNNSTDNSIAIVKQYQQQIPNLRLICASDRPGASYARNVGVKAATGEAILFCDADDQVDSKWLATIGQALLKYDFVAGSFDYKQLNAPWLVNSHLFDVQQTGLSFYKFSPNLPFAGGGSVGIKRSIHQAVGGFNENLLCAEDIDYCWRVQLAGTQLHFIKEAVIHVRLRHTFKDLYNQGQSWAESYIYLRLLYGLKVSKLISFGHILKALLYPLKGVFYLRSKSNLAKWVWIFGWNIGLVRGSFKYSNTSPAKQSDPTKNNKKILDILVNN